MTLDDESLLSAYLDGELGLDEQQAVESAAIADPRLAEELRGLVHLRELLAGLPREAPRDLTERVMRRVRRGARPVATFRSLSWAPAGAVVLTMATAAGLLLAVALSWAFQHLGRGPSGQPARDLVAHRDSGGEGTRRALPEHRWPPGSSRPAPKGGREAAPRESGDQRVAVADRSDAEGSTPGELVHVREYLDNPRLRRVFMISDLGDGSTERKVADIVEQTTQFSYFKFTISQGIVIDPRHPDRATVFALVVGPDELDDLRGRLRTALKDRVEEEPASPRIVTHLADIGNVQACKPAPLPDLAIPREHLAFQATVGGPGAPPGAERPKAITRPTPEQERSTPDAERRIAKAHPSVNPARPAARRDPTPVRPAPAGDADESHVVLVWVYRARPG